jgi:hypothetical protein
VGDHAAAKVEAADEPRTPSDPTPHRPQEHTREPIRDPRVPDRDTHELPERSRPVPGG